MNAAVGAGRTGYVTCGHHQALRVGLAPSTRLLPTIELMIGVTTRNGEDTSTVTLAAPPSGYIASSIAGRWRQGDARLLAPRRTLLGPRSARRTSRCWCRCTAVALDMCRPGMRRAPLFRRVRDRDLRVHQAAQIDGRQQQEKEDRRDEREFDDGLPARARGASGSRRTEGEHESPDRLVRKSRNGRTGTLHLTLPAVLWGDTHDPNGYHDGGPVGQLSGGPVRRTIAT